MKINYINSLILMIIISLFSSCSNNDDDTNDNSEIVTLEIKHYRVPAIGLNLLLTTSAREDNDSNFSPFFNSIEGFTYELGFDYEFRGSKI